MIVIEHLSFSFLWFASLLNLFENYINICVAALHVMPYLKRKLGGMNYSLLIIVSLNNNLLSIEHQ